MSQQKTPKDEDFANKKSVTMFFTTPLFALNYVDLLNYCYRSEQDRFHTIPTFRRVAKRIGVKEETVSQSSSRLQANRLLNADCSVISPCPRLDLFQPLEALKKNDGNQHFSRWLRNWKCYIRHPGPSNILTVPTTTLYSLIRNSAINGWKPNEGWTIEYLTLVTGISQKTVKRSLETLQEKGFLEVLDNMRFRLFKLQPCQLACFSDNMSFSGATAEPDEFVDTFSPASELMLRDQEVRQEFSQWLKRWPIDEGKRDWVFQTVIKLPNWEQNWNETARKYVEKAMAQT